MRKTVFLAKATRIVRQEKENAAAAPFGPLPDRICFLDELHCFHAKINAINPVEFSRASCVQKAEFNYSRRGENKITGGAKTKILD